MSCYHPLRAWRTKGGQVILHKEQPDSYFLLLPCGGCIGCRMAAAKAWALRCRLELQQHRNAMFTTLTYAEDQLPPTLQRRDLALWLKRLRKECAPERVRFFASGEYGEKRGRPHYHAILYGLDASKDSALVERTWGLGHTHTTDVTPRAIAYVAGYTSKKAGWRRQALKDIVDPETGEVLGTWQPPFIQMSRRPGIGAHARQWPDSWRSYAISDGYKLPVPRYLHESWKATASAEQKEELLYEKSLMQSNRNAEQLYQKEMTAIAKQAITADGRKL